MITNNKKKENTWYHDIAIAIYMTYNLSLYITSDLDYQIVKIKTANNIILKMQDTSTINLYILVKNKHT